MRGVYLKHQGKHQEKHQEDEAGTDQSGAEPREGGRKGNEGYLLCVSGMPEKLLGQKGTQQGGKGDPDLPELRQ